jgi:hypothetical protein
MSAARHRQIDKCASYGKRQEPDQTNFHLPGTNGEADTLVPCTIGKCLPDPTSFNHYRYRGHRTKFTTATGTQRPVYSLGELL